MSLRGALRPVTAAVALALFAAAALADGAPQPGPQGPAEGPYRKQEWRIPVLDADGRTGRLLEALLYRPAGEAKRPLVVISHGTPRRMVDRTGMRPDWAERPAAFFVADGYAVIVPMRRGYGRSPGEADDHAAGGCSSPDYYDAGLRVGRQILAIAEFMRRQSFVEGGRIVLAGQSAGGFATLAAASWNPAGVVALVNFAGGRGSRAAHDVCGEARLVEAMERFGAGTRIPSIWLYSANDTYFRPELAHRLHAAYARGGARTSLHILPRYGRDGHGFVRRADSEGAWHPLVRDFLAGLGIGARRAAAPAFPRTGPGFERRDRRSGNR